MIPLGRPHRLPGLVLTMRAYGPFGGSVRVGAALHPDQVAIADERGEITYRELDDTVNRVANTLRASHTPGQTIGILSTNHRGPLVAAWAASRAGLNTVWLNTAFSARQAAEVATREGVDTLFCDRDLRAKATGLVVRFIELDITQPTDGLTDLARMGNPAPPPRPKRPGRIILLTSGTTGTPKGAPRTEPRGYSLPGSLLDRMPMRARDATVVGAPLFHGTGLIMTSLTIGLGGTVVLRRTFDPETFVADIERHRASTVCMVPIMAQRVLALGPEKLSTYDTTSLRVAFCSGSALPAAVSAAFQEHFGPVIYNLYGSTEVSVATIATPADVAEAPTSVGRPALGSRVAVLDDEDRPVAQGERGRVFVGTVTPFEGYTGGGGKVIVDGMLATGDTGHVDARGRLYVDGRDDDMLVSGGENVFPAEVEEVLVAHPAVHEVAAIGVDDPEFGQRLRVFVVLHDGRSVSADEIRAHVRDNLARYKVPRDVVFLAALPRNPAGKVLKRELTAHDETTS